MKPRDHAGVFVPPPLLFVVPLIGALLINQSRPWPIMVDESLRLAAAFVLIALGISIGIAGVAAFREAKTTILPAGRPTTTIVDHGPYRFTRNPMYVAMALGYLGLAALFDSWWPDLVLPLILLVVDSMVIRREERYLSEKFGEPYVRYMQRVRRWI
jgi:protein-S-isoprenylcysteine O-methyltransferase Ste14